MSMKPSHFVWITAKVTTRTRRCFSLLVIDRDMRERTATLDVADVQGEREVPDQSEYRELLVPVLWAHRHKVDTGPIATNGTRLQYEDYSALERRILALQANGQAPKAFKLPPLPTAGLTVTWRQFSKPEYQDLPRRK